MLLALLKSCPARIDVRRSQSPFGFALTLSWDWLRLWWTGASFYLNMLHSDPVLSTDTACSAVHNVFVGSLPVNSCYRCVELEHCGFCSGTGRCSSGTSRGDSEGVCMDWSYGSCDYGYGYLSVISMVSELAMVT